MHVKVATTVPPGKRNKTRPCLPALLDTSVLPARLTKFSVQQENIKIKHCKAVVNLAWPAIYVTLWACRYQRHSHVQLVTIARAEPRRQRSSLAYLAPLILTQVRCRRRPACLARWAITALLARPNRSLAARASFLEAQANRHALHAPQASSRRRRVPRLALLVAPGSPHHPILQDAKCKCACL